MATSGFNALMQNLAGIDFFSGILPFVISYVIFYGALQKAPILGDGDDDEGFGERANMILAVAFAFLVTRFVITNALYQQFFVEYFGRLVIGMVGLLGLVMLLIMVGWNPEEHPLNAFTILAILVIFGAFSISNGLYAFIPGNEIFGGMSLREFFQFLVDSGIGYLIIIGVAIWWASSEKDEDDSLWQKLLTQSG